MEHIINSAHVKYVAREERRMWFPLPFPAGFPLWFPVSPKAETTATTKNVDIIKNAFLNSIEVFYKGCKFKPTIADPAIAAWL